MTEKWLGQWFAQITAQIKLEQKTGINSQTVIGATIWANHCPDQAEAETWRQQAEVIWASDLPKSLAETGQITRRDRDRNWTESQRAIGADWASDLPKSLAETAQITLTAEIDSRGGKTAGNQISNFQKSKSNSITTNTIPRATKEFLT